MNLDTQEKYNGSLEVLENEDMKFKAQGMHRQITKFT